MGPIGSIRRFNTRRCVISAGPEAGSQVEAVPVAVQEQDDEEIIPEFHGVEYTDADLQKEYDEIRDAYTLNLYRMSMFARASNNFFRKGQATESTSTI